MAVKVKEIMQELALLVSQDDPLERVVNAMLEHQVSCVGVVDDDSRLVGVIREEEFQPKERILPFSTEVAPQLFGEWVSPHTLEQEYAVARNKAAREVMVSPDTGVISEEARLSEALPRLERGHCLLVARGDRAVGMLTRHDLLKLVLRDGSDDGHR